MQLNICGNIFFVKKIYLFNVEGIAYLSSTLSLKEIYKNIDSFLFQEECDLIVVMGSQADEAAADFV